MIAKNQNSLGKFMIIRFKFCNFVLESFINNRVLLNKFPFEIPVTEYFTPE